MSITVSEFEQLSEDHRRSLIAFARKISHEKQADAEDLVQDALLRAYKYLNKFDPDRGSFYTWMRLQIYHIWCDRQRSKSKRDFEQVSFEDLIETDDPVQEDCLEDLHGKELLINILMELDGQEGAALMLLIEGYSCQEAAKKMGISPDFIYRLRRRLRPVLEEMLQE